MKLKENFHNEGCGCPLCQMGVDDFMLPGDDVDNIDGYASGYELAPDPIDQELSLDDPDLIASIVTQVIQQLQGGVELEEQDNIAKINVLGTDQILPPEAHHSLHNPANKFQPKLAGPCDDVVWTAGGYDINPEDFIPLDENSTTSKVRKGIRNQIGKLFQEQACREHIRENIKLFTEQAVFPKDHPLYNPNAPVQEDEPIMVMGKEVNVDTIEIDGVSPKEGPDDGTVDAYAEYAEFIDETPLNPDELDFLTDEYRDLIHEKALEQYFEGGWFQEGEGGVCKNCGQIHEGSCGYSQMAPGGQELSTPGGTKGMSAYERTKQRTIGEGPKNPPSVQTARTYKGGPNMRIVRRAGAGHVNSKRRT